MRISEERHAILYSALSNPIMELRIALMDKSTIDVNELDGKLFRLELEIHKRIKKALNIQEKEMTQ